MKRKIKQNLVGKKAKLHEDVLIAFWNEATDGPLDLSTFKNEFTIVGIETLSMVYPYTLVESKYELFSDDYMLKYAWVLNRNEFKLI